MAPPEHDQPPQDAAPDQADDEVERDLLAEACRSAGLDEAALGRLTEWLGRQLERESYARLEQAGHSVEERIPLAKVFVDLEVAELPEGEIEAPRAPTRLILQHLCGAHPEHALLLGGPGQGKSTLGQLLCQLHRAWLLQPRVDSLSAPSARGAVAAFTGAQAQTELGRPEILRLPIRIPLADAAAWLANDDAIHVDKDMPALLRWLAWRAEREGSALSPLDLLPVLRHVDWLLVLDGLDEVPASSNREEILEAARLLLSALDPTRGLLLATTRPQGYAGELSTLGAPLRTYHMAPLSMDRALTYGQRLVTTRFLPDRQETVLSRLEQAASAESTARLMRTPLQVTILATLVDRIGRAPSAAWALFHEYYRVIYEREMERPIPASQLLREYRAHIDRIHARVGLLLQVEAERSGGTGAALTQERFAEVVDAVLAEDEIDAARRAALVSELGRAARERLVLIVEPNPGKLGFEVRSLQEFMAAWALSQKKESVVEARIRQILKAASFRGVLLFMASKAFTELSDLRDDLVDACRRLNDDPEDPLAQVVKAGSVLAVEILQEGSALKQDKYVRMLTEIAVDVLWLPPDAIHARLSLACMADTEASSVALPILLNRIDQCLRDPIPARRGGAIMAIKYITTEVAGGPPPVAVKAPLHELTLEMRAAEAQLYEQRSRPDSLHKLRAFLQSTHDLSYSEDEAEHALLAIWNGLMADDWPFATLVFMHLMRALARRQSGLSDPATWDRLELPLPYPEQRTPSVRPPPSAQRPVVISSLRLENLRIFDDLSLTPAPPDNGDGQWIVLIGENGAGKSTLLRALALALVDLQSQPNRLPASTFAAPWRHRGVAPTARSLASVTVRGRSYQASFHVDPDRNPDAERFQQAQPPSPGSSDDEPSFSFPVFAYGCRRGSALGGASRQVNDAPGAEIYTLFDEGADLIHAETWFLLRENEAQKDKEGPAGQVFRAIQQALCAVLRVDAVWGQHQEVWVRGAEVGEMPLAALSDGYLTTMGWIVDLIARWIRRAELRKEPIHAGFTQTMTGLVLIDEIDLYLHPSWQRHVITDIRKVFPRLSFVVTTHNPLTLLGAKAREIWRLRRCEDGRVIAEQGQETPALLTGSDIYDAYFGISKLFPDELGEMLDRYSFLARNAARTDDEEAEMQDLRRKLREREVEPGWEPVPREALPPYPGDPQA